MKTADPEWAIDFQGVTFKLGGVDLLDQITWQVPTGATVALLGGNGSGKSTLLRLIAGYHYPTAGEMKVLGGRFGETDLSKLRRRIGVVDPESPFRFDERTLVRDAVATGFFGNLTPWFNETTDAHQVEVDEAMSLVGILSTADRLLSTVSTGERRRVLLARAFLQRPDLLLLDEPTAGLDVAGRESFLNRLEAYRRNQPATTIVIATHQLEDLLPSTDQVMLLASGKAIAVGDPQAVLNSKNVSRALGVPIDVYQKKSRWYWTVSGDDA